MSKNLDWPIDEARQLAGYSPVEIDWSKVTASELFYVLEDYPRLSEDDRQFVRDQIVALVEFLLEKDETGGSGLRGKKGITPVEKIVSIKLDNISEERDRVKKKRKKRSS